MRLVPLTACAAAFALAAGAAHAADSQLSCKGDALVMPDQSTAPLEVQLTIAGGLSGPTGITYAWRRPEAPVPLALKGLVGDTLEFHGMTMAQEGGVLVADARLNRNTLALVLKVRRIGGSEEDITLETTCLAA
jgi:hypothetical protein